MFAESGRDPAHDVACQWDSHGQRGADHQSHFRHRGNCPHCKSLSYLELSNIDSKCYSINEYFCWNSGSWKFVYFNQIWFCDKALGFNFNLSLCRFLSWKKTLWNMHNWLYYKQIYNALPKEICSVRPALDQYLSIMADDSVRCLHLFSKFMHYNSKNEFLLW